MENEETNFYSDLINISAKTVGIEPEWNMAEFPKEPVEVFFATITTSEVTKHDGVLNI